MGFDWGDYLRARNGFRQRNGEGARAAASSESAEDRDPAEQRICVDQMISALASLPREQRLTFELRVAGYSFSEIAEKLGCSHGNAKHHAYRGIQRLRRIVFNGKKPGATIRNSQTTKLQAKTTFQ